VRKQLLSLFSCCLLAPEPDISNGPKHGPRPQSLAVTNQFVGQHQPFALHGNQLTPEKLLGLLILIFALSDNA